MLSERQAAGKRSIDEAFDAYTDTRRRSLDSLEDRLRDSQKRARASRAQLERTEAAHDTLLSDDSDEGADTPLTYDWEHHTQQHADREGRVRADERAYFEQRDALDDVFTARRQYDRLPKRPRRLLDVAVDQTMTARPTEDALKATTEAIKTVRDNERSVWDDVTRNATIARNNAGAYRTLSRWAQRDYNVADERAARQLSDSDDDAPHIEAHHQQAVVDTRRQAAEHAERYAQLVDDKTTLHREELTGRAKALDEFERTLGFVQENQLGTGMQRVLSNCRIVS